MYGVLAYLDRAGDIERQKLDEKDFEKQQEQIKMEKDM